MKKNDHSMFKNETAGKLMNEDFISILEWKSVDEALMYVRENVKNKRNIHDLYIVDKNHKLKGMLSIRELLSACGNQPITNLMVSNVTSLSADVDQELAANIFRDSDLVSIPVLNQRQQLVGVVHADEILDVMQQEATGDSNKIAAMSSLKDASIFTLYRKRIAWLIILVFMNIFSGAGIAHFEDIIESTIALVFFLPLLVDSGGNAGSQASTLMIRAMAIGDIKGKDWLKLFTKEISVSLCLGLTMALAVSSIGFYRGGIDIAIVVSLTMVLIVMVGSMIGMSLPFMFRKIKLDPATASAPLITSIADIVGVLLYFSTAAWYLNL